MTQIQKEAIYSVLRKRHCSSLTDLVAAIGPDPIKFDQWDEWFLFTKAVAVLSNGVDNQIIDNLNIVFDREIYRALMTLRRFLQDRKSKRFEHDWLARLLSENH